MASGGASGTVTVEDQRSTLILKLYLAKTLQKFTAFCVKFVVSRQRTVVQFVVSRQRTVVQFVDRKTVCGERTADRNTFCGERTADRNTFCGEQTADRSTVCGEQTVDRSTFCGERTADRSTFCGERTADRSTVCGEQTADRSTVCGEQTADRSTVCGEQTVDRSTVCGEQTADRSTVSRWVTRFRDEHVNVNDDPRAGRAKTSTDERSVKLVADFLAQNRRAMCEKISQATGISPTSVFRILTKDLQKRKLCARWVPPCLTAEQKTVLNIYCFIMY